MLPPIVHVVRRYGCVGGMEKYVWELTHRLCEQGVSIEIVCETVTGTPDPRIHIHKVPISRAKPRWKSMLNFRALVGEILVRELSKRKLIIHSHERSIHHHVTTFHGPPMQGRKVLWGIPWLNRRVCAWEKMEREELFGEKVQKILPVSDLVKNQLGLLYPQLQSCDVELAWPGVDDANCQSSHRPEDRTRLNLLFVGAEWKRKGFERAVKIAEQVAKYKNVTLDVYGLNPLDLPKKMAASPVLRFKGWVSEIPWGDYTALIHPAENEPFGMVIPEARQNAVPVLTSSATGSAELGFRGVRVCSTNDSIDVWVRALETLLADPEAFRGELLWSWRNLADLHIKKIYRSLRS